MADAIATLGVVVDVLGLGRLRLPGADRGEALELRGGRRVEHCRRWADLSNNCEALRLLLEYRQSSAVPLGRVLDCCAGVGLWATVVSSFRPDSLTLTELDAACAAHLRAAFPRCAVRSGDGLCPRDGDDAFDLVLMDLTKCTLRTVHGLAGRRLSMPGDVILTDCAGIKLHLNYRSYGLRRGSSYDDYLAVYDVAARDRYGRGVAAVVVCGVGLRPRSAYLLLCRGARAGWRFPVMRADRPDGLRLVN